MRRNAIVLAAVITLLISILASAQTDPLEGPIRDLIKQHFEAMKAENIDAVLMTIHPQSPNYDGMKSMLAQLFPVYDLSYEYRILTIEIKSDALAYVDIEQTTRKVGGQAQFRDNMVHSRSELRKYEGDWKLFSSSIIGEPKYLN